MNLNSSAEKKKKIESHYLDRLREAMPDFPSGRIEPTEEPDFLVHGETRIIGIELTELHRETPNGLRPQQALEATRHQTAAKARELYIATNSPPVRVSIFFYEDCDITKAQVLPLAERIADLVANHLPENNSSIEIKCGRNNPDSFPKPLMQISVHRFDVITESFFSSPGATWVLTLSDADIARAIEPKEKKYSTYRKQCDEAWLIINADIGSMSTWFDFDCDSMALLKPLQTQFQRVFILLHFGSQLFELAKVPHDA
jgi:hypothetical protein